MIFSDEVDVPLWQVYSHWTDLKSVAFDRKSFEYLQNRWIVTLMKKKQEFIHFDYEYLFG